MLVSVEGSVISVSEVHSRNACWPMVVMPVESTHRERDLHPRKEFSPMEVPTAWPRWRRLSDLRLHPTKVAFSQPETATRG